MAQNRSQNSIIGGEKRKHAPFPAGVYRRAFECTCDKQDRILVPPSLRQYALLEKEIVLVGVLDHFEIWSRDNYDKETMILEKDMKKEEVRNEIAKLGI